jgi:hypothetical protein
MANQYIKDSHEQLSELTDNVDNVYALTKDIAGVAKRIKFDTREEIEPPTPVFEAIKVIYESRVDN